MKNRDKLRSRALYDLMMTIARCRYKRCPIEIVGERKPECDGSCEKCVQEWLNREVEK
jgi:hypothetical protein